MDYKDTINLPQTDFPMKANLAQKEGEMLKKWQEQNLYQILRDKSQGRPKFILHDGPPYANGHIHLGTSLNKILKDIIIKVKSMQGFDAPYIPGWDCHGLPIEQHVDKELGAKKKDLKISDIRNLCRAYARKYIDIQREEFKRLGVFGDWDHPYLTLNPAYTATIVREMGKFLESGAMYRGLKPIHWCPTCRTALAEAEIEYDNHQSPSVFVKFFLEPSNILPESPASIVIWTTTPWTLPANLAVSVHPDFEYQAVKANNEVFILAKELVKGCMEKFGLTHYEVIKDYKGSSLEGLQYRHPFNQKILPVILGTHVTLEQGTGCVHTAPGHGEEDYEIGLKYGLSVYNTVDSYGKFFEDVPLFGGKNVFAANREINDTLKASGHLLKEETISHSYPHCWRCKKPLLFRATPQWFISLKTNNLREKILSEIEKVKWIPAWGRDRIYNMVNDRPDWCISRQRSWGVPIIAFYCQSCHEPLASKNISDHVAALMEKEGSDIWFEKEAKDLLPAGTKCPKCQHAEFKKETDILDVWFDSGVSHCAVLENNPKVSWPADLYLEGSDQHRGWFQSSIIHSVGTRQTAPYKSVLTHGYVVDGQGKKMSKSLGNVISPDEIIKKYGVEILRLWVVSENYTEDIRISPEILQRLSDAYRKIRNTFRFCLGNLSDFDQTKDAVEFAKLEEIDRLILHRMNKLIERITQSYNNFSYHIFFHSFYNFCTVDLSALYFDIIKDRIYIYKKDDPRRRAAQTVIYQLVSNLARLMAPILPFTAEEIWSHLPGKSAAGSIHFTEMPTPEKKYFDPELEKEWEAIITGREEVNKVLEAARRDKKIGHSLEAKITLPNLEIYTKRKADLPSIFITSQVDFGNDANSPITFSPAEGKKCERCWNYSEQTGADPEYPNTCERCAGILKSLKS